MNKKKIINSIMGMVKENSRGLLGDRYALNVDLNKLEKDLHKILG